jgi:hypothetical protein
VHTRMEETCWRTRPNHFPNDLSHARAREPRSRAEHTCWNCLRASGKLPPGSNGARGRLVTGARQVQLALALAALRAGNAFKPFRRQRGKESVFAHAAGNGFERVLTHVPPSVRRAVQAA